MTSGPITPAGAAPDPAATPAIAVVVAANGTPGSVPACLEALEPQRAGAEIVVAEPTASPPDVRARFPWARFLVRRDALVPVLWRDGIDATEAPLVALTISPMRPAPDWLSSLRDELSRADVVAGAIDPADGIRLQDRAEHLCRYARDMRPFAERESVDLPGDNCGYRRERLLQVQELYRDGLWEPVVNRRLAELGARLVHTPRVVVRQGPSAGWRPFVRQRLHHGRAHGRQRGAGFSGLRNVLGILGAPLVPGLLTLRALREARARGADMTSLGPVLPLLVLFDAAWAVGEARGHLDVLAGG